MPDEVSRKGSFIATDAALRLHEIVIMEVCARRCHVSADSRRILQTVDGNAVIRKAKGRHELSESGLALRSYDPACP
jgi:hypothetical protein